jgi:hypothetical protein
MRLAFWLPCFMCDSIGQVMTCTTMGGAVSGQTLIALITAVASLVVSVVTAAVSSSFRRHNETELEKLKNQLAEEQGESAARRDYVYDARKRLYTEFQPVLFQMMERCSGATVRIKGMAESARTGRIIWPGRLGEGWKDDPNHMISTSWDLMMPLALFRIGQQKLTGVDMSVDKVTGWQYLLARELYSSWGMGYQLAAEKPILRHDDEERETRQYILSSHLEQIADCLIRRDEQGQLNCIRFSEFSNAFFKDGDPEFTDALSHITLPLTNFHPQGKPVLWRLLLVQAHLHAAIIKTFATVADGRPQRIHPVDALTSAEWDDFDWRSDDSLSREEAVVIPFESARSFLTKRLEMD